MRPSLVAAAWALAIVGCVTAGGSTLAEPNQAGVTGAPALAVPPPLDRSNCTFNGHALYGKIKVVNALADVKVQVVTAFPDLRVQKVSALAGACGQWEMVDSLADTTVELVHAFPDVKIEFVHAFPGIP
jgi:hypothetical protein